jgi:hypothetical protein
MSESEFLVAVLELCRLRGVLAHHCRPARMVTGWRTPISGDVGFPDLVIAGRRGVLLRELKTAVGRLSEPQCQWIDRLGDAGSDVDVWRPSDLASGRIDRELRAVA